MKRMLNKVIENKRKKMIDSAKKYGMNSKITIKHSQELDKLINLYLRTTKK